MDETRKKNLTNTTTWMRLVYMILFAVAFNVAEIVLGVVVIVGQRRCDDGYAGARRLHG